MRRFLFLFIQVVVGIICLGCATRHYVKNQIETIEPQIADIHYTQSEQARRIDQVDRLSKTALAAADQAEMAAKVVNEIAGAAVRKAMDAERRADTAQVDALRAIDRIATVEMAIEDRVADLDRDRTAEQNTITFSFDSDVLSQEAISRLDDFAETTSGADSGHLIELQGLTDNTGTEKYNVALSERRAASVLHYRVGRGISAASDLDRRTGQLKPDRGEQDFRRSQAKPPRGSPGILHGHDGDSEPEWKVTVSGRRDS